MELFIQNKYTTAYFKIIEKAKLDNRSKKDDYYENHHIIPKCSPFNGTNDKPNRVLLTPKEHFICHLLLTKMCEGIFKIKMVYALNNMTRSSSHNKRKLTSGQYAIAKRILSKNKTGTKLPEDKKKNLRGRIPWNKGKTKDTDSRIMEYSLKMSGDNHHRPWLGRKMSDKQKKELSSRQMGENNSFYGKSHSNEFKLSQSKKMTGRKHTEESKRIIAQKKMGNSATAGSKWVNDGNKEKLIPAGTQIPDGFSFGRLKRKGTIE
jgi:hypothetical protein